MVSRRRFAAAIAGAALLARIPTVFAAKPYDLLIRKGRIIDPSVGLDLVGDLAVSGGRIAAIGPAIEGEVGPWSVDAGLQPRSQVLRCWRGFRRYSRQQRS